MRLTHLGFGPQWSADLFGKNRHGEALMYSREIAMQMVEEGEIRKIQRQGQSSIFSKHQITHCWIQIDRYTGVRLEWIFLMERKCRVDKAHC